MKKRKETQHLVIIMSLFVKFILAYIIILTIFACLFLHSGGLCITGNDTTANSFFDCLYFSFITFHTIGYGDIIPNNHEAKILIMVLSFLSLAYTTLFAGFIIDAFIKRRDILRFHDVAHKTLNEIIYDFAKQFIPPQFINPKGYNYYIIKENDFKVDREFNMKDSIKKLLDDDIKNYYEFNKKDFSDGLQSGGNPFLEKYICKIKSINIFKEKLDGFISIYGQYVDNDKILLPIQNIKDEIIEFLRFKDGGSIKDFEEHHYTICDIVIKSLLIRQNDILRSIGGIPSHFNNI